MSNDPYLGSWEEGFALVLGLQDLCQGEAKRPCRFLVQVSKYGGQRTETLENADGLLLLKSALRLPSLVSVLS